MFGNMTLFLVLNRISHSFVLLEVGTYISLEINFIFPHIHVLFSISATNKSDNHTLSSELLMIILDT